MHRLHGSALAAGLVFVLALPGLVQAAPKSFVANRADDHVPNGCTRSDCTLREAVIAANEHAGLDNITLRARTYELALPSTSEDAAADGDLDIKGRVQMTGKGPTKTVVDGGGTTVHDVAFDVFPGGRVAITGLSERHSAGDGATAGIFVEQNARLEMARVKVIDNNGSCCNGIFTESGSELSLSRVSVANNTGSGCCNGINTASDSSLVLERVVVSDNTGGCCNGVDALGALRATRTVIRGNNGDDSNGLYTGEGRVVLNKVKVLDNDATSTSGQNGVYLGDGNAVIKDIRIVGNSGGPSGNGCCNGLGMGAGNLTLRRAVISHNSSGGCCNGILGDEGEATLRDIVVSGNNGSGCCQGIESYSSPMTITRATVSENVDSTNCCTGIISDSGGPVTLRNVTVSGNSAATFAGGISTGGPITMNNVTVTNNRADSDDTGGDNGGGIFVGAGAVQIQNSIVAGNSVGSGGTGPDCFGALTSGGHNLIGDTDGCTIASGGGNLLGVAPLLAPLRNNGGFTATHALKRHSPAIDMGSGKTPGTGGKACETRDQRGVRRPRAGRCDIGAYER